MKFWFLPGLAAALMILAGLSQGRAAFQAGPEDYDKALGDLVESMGDTLVDLSRESQTRMGVALFREQDSGQRSAFCARLENDLAKKIRDGTVFAVPDAYITHAALKQVSGYATDPSQPEAARSLGGLLKVDSLLYGSYAVRGNVLVIQVHLVQCQEGIKIWSGTRIIPAGEIKPSEGDLMPGTRPDTYTAPDTPVPTPVQESAPVATATPKTGEETRASSAAAAHPSSDLSRGSLALGYKYFLPKDPTFSSVTGSISGEFAKVCWADLVNAQFEMWNVPSVALSDINSLWAYGFRLSATWPFQLGPHLKIYGGAGGKTESIVVNPKYLPSQYGVSFGNNSFYGTLGVKLHLGPWGLDFEFAQDFAANYTDYTGIQTGLYYEFGYE